MIVACVCGWVCEVHEGWPAQLKQIALSAEAVYSVFLCAVFTSVRARVFVWGFTPHTASCPESDSVENEFTCARFPGVRSGRSGSFPRFSLHSCK